jgi:proteic killer suppression protein
MKVMNSERELIRDYGPDNGRRIGLRLQNIRDAATLEDLSKLPQTRVHELKADRNEQISVDAKHPWRLILICHHEEAPRKPDGGLDWARITKVQLIEITDTH